MNKYKYIFFSVLTLLIFSTMAFAQGAADNESTVTSSRAIGAGLGLIGFGLAAGLAGIGQGLVGSRAAEGAARNPGAVGSIQTLMIIALALIESLVLFALLLVFLKVA
jgi:F-type H+-transporting ATPase subunit c